MDSWQNDENVNKNIHVDGDEYISAAALILAVLANGQSTLHNFSHAVSDTNLLNYLKIKGIGINKQGDDLIVAGQGINALTSKITPGFADSIYTLVSILTYGKPILDFEALDIKDHIATMNANIKKAMASARIKHKQKVIYDLSIKHLDEPIKAGYFYFKLATLLGALPEVKKVNVNESFLSPDHTERLFSYFGISQESWGKKENRITLETSSKPFVSQDLAIPNDISLAASSIVETILSDDGYLELNNMVINRKRISFLYALKYMGADIKIKHRNWFGFEPVGDITVQGGKTLKGVVLPGHIVINMKNELPLVMFAAAHAEGITSFYGVYDYTGELFEECNNMLGKLKAFSIQVSLDKEKLDVKGNSGIKF